MFARSSTATVCGDGAALLERDGAGWLGLSRREVLEWADGADLFVNLSGRFHLRDVMRAARRRVYVDLDPGFTQIWQAQYGVDMNLAGHDAYVTVGLNLGRADCRVPTLGLPWRPLCPPVVRRPNGAPLDEVGDAYTTVADWRGYAPIEWEGVWYKQKSDEFLRLIELPGRAPCPLEICLAIHPDEPDLPRLRAHGWQLSRSARARASTARHTATTCGARAASSASPSTATWSGAPVG